MSQNIEIKLKAVDEASNVVASASSKINNDLNSVSQAQRQVSKSTKDSEASMKSFASGLSGVATASFSLYNAFDRVNQAELSVDRANLQVKSSTKSVDDAQRALNEAISKHGSSSDEATAASERLSLAQERLSVSNEQAQQAQDNVSKAIMASALQVIPTAITMVDGLGKAWNNLPDISGLLSNISTKIAETGITAKTAAIGTAAFFGSFLIADQLLSAIPEDMRAVAGALTASIAAIVAATVAWMAFHGTMTVGVAVPIILAAVGAGIAGVKAAVALAEGGVVDRPTLALVGEAGPEIVMPLSQYEKKMENNQSSSFRDSPQQVIQIDIGGMHFYGDIADSKFLEKAAEVTVEKMSDSLYRRIGGG
jgi:hypothetical protein